jgi:hypothetical protein
MSDLRKAEAIAVARREIARRIARFCTSLSPQEFERLLDRMANIHWKYDVLPNLDLVFDDGDEEDGVRFIES